MNATFAIPAAGTLALEVQFPLDIPSEFVLSPAVEFIRELDSSFQIERFRVSPSLGSFL